MKILLFADKEVGLEIAKFMISEYKHDLVAIVTSGVNEVSYHAKENQIKTYVYDEIIHNLNLIDSEFDYGVLAWWPFLIGSTLLELPRHGFINTHPSLLPLNRGKNPNFWTLVNGDPYGVTIHKVTMNIDDGNIMAQDKIEYDWCDNGASLYRLGQSKMVELFSRFYPTFRLGQHVERSQGLTGTIHYGSQLHAASEIKLDKLYSGKDILNLLRARTFPGHPGCWFRVINEGGEDLYQATIEIRKMKS
ncbi:formyltransferase family protein [Polynucleobacter sp.]|uniref:formyltransferase family protein n=1 Tax=Polynucleobacter sp. TaxID=2029855 RepID=UPI003F6A3CA8